jgi:hypothetical protein
MRKYSYDDDGGEPSDEEVFDVVFGETEDSYL